MSVLCLKTMDGSGYAKNFKEGTGLPHKLFPAATIFAALALSFIFAGEFGLFVPCAVILGYALALWRPYKEFQGVSGDLAGFAIVLSELCGLLALALI